MLPFFCPFLFSFSVHPYRFSFLPQHTSPFNFHSMSSVDKQTLYQVFQAWPAQLKNTSYISPSLQAAQDLRLGHLLDAEAKLYSFPSLLIQAKINFLHIIFISIEPDHSMFQSFERLQMQILQIFIQILSW